MSHEYRHFGIEAAKRTVTNVASELLAPVEWREEKHLTLGTGTVSRWRMNFYPGDLQVSERVAERYVLFRLKEATHSFTVMHNALQDAEYTPGMVTGFSWADADNDLRVWQQLDIA